MYLVIDTETNGLFDFSKPADGYGQPRLCSVAMIQTDEEGSLRDAHKFYIRPDGWSVDGTEAARVNGLTDAFLQANGVPVKTAFEAYSCYIEQGFVICAFNAQFDCKVMRAELRRAQMPDLFERTLQTCVQRAMKEVEGFTPARRGYPNLRESAAFFGHTIIDAHDAMADAAAARVILRNVIRLGRLIPPAVHYAKNRPTAA